MSLAIRTASRFVGGRDHAQHRPEDLLAGDRRAVVDVAEHRRLDEPAAVEVRRAGRRRWPASRPRRCPWRCSPRTRSRWRSMASGPIWVASSNGSPTLHLREGVGERVERARRGAAADTTIRVSEEQTWPVRIALGAGDASARPREVGVVEDDGGRLAAELERAAGDALAAHRGDPAAGRGGTGEGDLVDARVAYEQLGDLAVGRHDVEHARREADLLGDLGERRSPRPAPRATT